MFDADTKLRLGSGLLIGLLLLVALPAVAQTTGATLTGTVRSQAGGAVAEAMIRARSADNGAVRQTESDAQGRYRFVLSPGSWVVHALLPDGGISAPQVVRLRLQETIQLDFAVAQGATERVRVTAAPPLIDRRETAGGLRVAGSDAEALPLGGRAITDLALLDSSVRQAGAGNYAGERGAAFSVNGQSGRSNSFLVDGLDNNDATSGTTLNSYFSQQVIEEFVLLTHQYSAEFGRASGGLLNIVTKRGSNEHGWSAFVEGSSASWNEPGTLVESLPDRGASDDATSRVQAGFTVGGPIRKDKSFYFVAYEHREQDHLVPFTGIDRDGIQGGRLAAPTKNDSLFFRADMNLGSSNTLMLRLSADDSFGDGINVGGVNTPETGFSIDEQDLQFAGAVTTIVSPRMLSETRFLVSTSEFEQNATSDLPGVSKPSGVYGGNVLNYQLRTEDKFQLVQNLTWTQGAHTMKFGVDLTYSSTDVHVRFNPNGNFIYDYDFEGDIDLGGCVGGSISEALAHEPDGSFECTGGTANIFSYPKVYTLVQGEPRNELNDTSIALFAQDKWSSGDRWVLDYGLRYDVSSYELPSSARVDSLVPNGGAKRDTDNLAPRFGFTFTPAKNGKLVVRGGAGMFYDKLVLAFPAVSAVTSDTKILLNFPQGFAQEHILPGKVEEDGPPFVVEIPAFTMQFSTGTELETPYTIQSNIGIEYPLTKFSAIRADYVHARGYHQPIMKDLNPVLGLIDPLGPACWDPGVVIEPDRDVGIPCHGPDPNLGSIAAVVTEGRSWYDGLDLNYRWQRDDQWVRASYTLSESEDMGFDPLKGGIALPPDSNNLSGERGRSDGDREHRLVLSGESPVGWWGVRATGILQFSTGQPFNVTTGQDDNTDGILSDRPPGVGRNEGASSSIDAINEVRDQPVVALDPITRLEEEEFFQIDLRLTKAFPVGDGNGAWQAFFQVINLLDTENVGQIEGRAISPDFGRTVALAGPPRTLEVGLRIGF
ncbi:MAG: TonB-dependent receptor [bacterium]|nr:TonB-dependent receptor [bacterium]